MRIVTRTLALAGLVASTLLTGTGAQAAPASASGQQIEWPCGYHTDPYAKLAFWRNCDPVHGDYINVDRILWADDQLCIPSGKRVQLGWALGRIQDIRGAQLLRDC
jgi:hypothetical protein